MATDAVAKIFRPGFRYSKAEVLLMDLRQRGEFTGDLFARQQPVHSDRLMGVLDSINDRWGRGTVRAARVPATPDGDAPGHDESVLYYQCRPALEGSLRLTLCG